MRLAALAIVAALAAAAPATATPRGHARGQCAESFEPVNPERWGPLTFNGAWNSSADWDGTFRPGEHSIYVKHPMYMEAGTVASLAIGPSARRVADWVYGHRRVDTVRLNGCRDKPSFFSGGLVVTKPVCVPVTLRVRGSDRVYRRTISIGMGDSCKAPSPTATAATPTRTCDQRAEAGGAPTPWRHHRDSVEVGPLSFASLKRVADPKVFEGFHQLPTLVPTTKRSRAVEKRGVPTRFGRYDDQNG
jgi:hypothetical protein